MSESGHGDVFDGVVVGLEAKFFFELGMMAAHQFICAASHAIRASFLVHVACFL